MTRFSIYVFVATVKKEGIEALDLRYKFGFSAEDNYRIDLDDLKIGEIEENFDCLRLKLSDERVKELFAKASNRAKAKASDSRSK